MYLKRKIKLFAYSICPDSSNLEQHELLIIFVAWKHPNCC